MKLRLLPFLALAAVLLVACGAIQGNPTAVPTAGSTPTAITPSKGMGGVSGRVEGISAVWAEGDIYLYAAPFTPKGDGSGFYILEPNIHPKVKLEAGGFFQLNEVPPGSYVLVVGPEPAEAKLIVDDKNETRVFEVPTDELLEVGVIQLAR